MKRIFLILGIIVLVFISAYLLFFRGVSLVWNTYENSKVSFSFKYPSNWTICEEFSPKFNYYTVHLYKDKVNCKEFPAAVGLSITESTEKIQETDVKEYLLKSEQEFKEEEQQRLQKGMLPMAPGFTWQFVKYINGLLLVKGASVAQVKGLADYIEYVVLYKGRVYSITPLWNTIPEKIIMRAVLWTVRIDIK